MSSEFDRYDQNYSEVVEGSIKFSGLKHDFFLQAKIDILVPKLEAYFSQRQGLQALDVGCGVGTLHAYYSSLFKSLSGVDISNDCIEQAAVSYPENDYRLIKGNSIPYENHSFDVTMTTCVMHHVPPQDWADFSAELKRVTRPGGMVCVIEHNPWNPLTRLSVLRCEFDHDAVLLSSRKTEGLLHEAGFKNVQSDFFLLFPTAKAVGRKIERFLGNIPLGAQYITTGVA